MLLTDESKFGGRFAGLSEKVAPDAWRNRESCETTLALSKDVIDVID